MKGLPEAPWKAQAIHESNPDIEWQTRRLIKPQPRNKCMTYVSDNLWASDKDGHTIDINVQFIKCPYSIGEEVYIKETHYRLGYWIKNGLTKTGRQKWTFKPESVYVAFSDLLPLIIRKNNYRQRGWYKRPSLFLPADLARTVVTITDIRAQRVQDISEKDAIAEGIDEWEGMYREYNRDVGWTRDAIYSFSTLWDSIHGSGAWERNDWVWAYTMGK